MITNFEEITTEAFPLGMLVITASANDALPGTEITKALRRHHSADWGDVTPEDKTNNNLALEKKGQLTSRYLTAKGMVFYIITEWNRSVTTVLLPEDY